MDEPAFVNVKMMTEDRKHLDEYLQPWLEMRADWEANKASGKFETPMTDAYFPERGLQPVSYGLVVLDFKTKHLLSCQDYCGLKTLGVWSHMDSDRREQAVALIRAGRVKTYSMFDDGPYRELELPAELLANPTVAGIRALVPKGGVEFDVHLSFGCCAARR